MIVETANRFKPTAYAVGFIITPLRGYRIFRQLRA